MKNTGKNNALGVTRAQDFPAWYQAVIKAADLAEHAEIRGCMIIKPWAMRIWNLIRAWLNQQFQLLNIQEYYFPLLIPLSSLEKEAHHIEGFAKECAVVTHHRLEQSENKLLPAGLLTEPLVIRPTSETTINQAMARWIQSYRDLPLALNQWANIMRWELRPRLFLRTAEFLWQEGHTAHANATDSAAMVKKIWSVYQQLATELLALPVIAGEKSAEERFPGAVQTYTIEALMQDGKALQAGTVHNLGQNFSRAFDINFQDQDGQQQHCWTTSWGVSTRLLGGIIMAHADDEGLCLPPLIAPDQIRIITIVRDAGRAEQLKNAASDLARQLKQLSLHQQPLRVSVVHDPEKNSSYSYWQAVKQGVPCIIEIGPRDLDNQQLVVRWRHHPKRDCQPIALKHAADIMLQGLEDCQVFYQQQAQQRLTANIYETDEFNVLKHAFEDEKDNFWYSVPVADTLDNIVQTQLKNWQASVRLVQNKQPAKCIFSGQTTNQWALLARSY